MRLLVFSVCGMILSGCTLDLPDTPIGNLENYIPEIRSKQDFPGGCIWADLQEVVDGDTVRVNYEGSLIKVRMVGVDAPEINHPTIGEEPFGWEATDFLKGNVSDRICLVESSTGDLYDRYGRKLAYVYNEEGENLNLLIIASGLAEYYRTFSYDRKDSFKKAEKLAKEAGLGMWE